MTNPLGESSRLFDLDRNLDEMEQSSFSHSEITTTSPTKATVARVLSFETAVRSTSLHALATPFT